MKDDLPDLTPYLSKKGGNSQGKGADNSAGKGDISSKLSALVKKTGTFSAVDTDVVIDSSSVAADAATVDIEQPSVNALANSSTNSASASSSAISAASSSSWEQVDSFSSSAASARLEAQAEALAQEQLFAQAAAGILPESDYTPYPENTPEGTAPLVVAPENRPENLVDASPPNSQSDTLSTPENFSTSDTFATRPIASRPGGSGPGPSLDKFKAPQARPMNTLSSGTPPVLKVTEREAIKTPAPYTFHQTGHQAGQQANEAPREVVVPKSMQLPTPSAPTSSTPGPSSQAKRTAESSKEPPPSWPAQPTSPPRIVEKTEKIEPLPQSQPSPRKQVQPETTSEIYAKAFKEEAKALEQNSDDMLEPLNQPEQNYIGSEDKYDSPYFEPKSKGPLGFGSLLTAGAATAPGSEADSASQKHSNLADLMIPTGQHQALFAPERRDDDGISPFDEGQTTVLSDNSQDNSFGDSYNNSAAYSDPPAAANAESVRIDEKAAAPAFTSLFSTEIVTSGQDYSFNDDKPSEFLSHTNNLADYSINLADNSVDQISQFPEVSSAFNIDEPPPQSFGVLSQSDAISKLLEVVNQEQQGNMNSDLANSFADPYFTESNYNESDDMRTADTMFGSGGSNKGSAEELSAADAVFGAVPERAAPMLEPAPVLESALPLAPMPNLNTSPNSNTSSNLSSSSFPQQPVLGKDSLPIAFANAENFEQESLESIKLGIRKAKAEEKARKKADEEAKLAAAQFSEAAKMDEVVAEKVESPASREDFAGSIKSSGQQSPKSTAKLSLTEMIELANSAKLEQVQDGKSASVEEQSAPAKYDESISKEEDDDGDSLGGAISDALDKLLSAGQEEQPPSFAINNTTQSSFADEPNFAPLSENTPKMPSQSRLEAFASTSNQVEVEAPFTQTQANKVDALSRLLEVASKAPNKSLEAQRNPSNSASKIAAEINKPPGRVSRQVETIQTDDYNQQSNQGAAMSSPFGGSSPFSSPFNSPSASHSQTRPASNDQSPPSAGMSNPYDGVSSMPQATVSNDAVSARIAALNRKLEEQNRPPSASAVNIDAMAQLQQQAEAQAQSQGQSLVGTGTGTSPSVNSLSQLPPQVDDSPSTRAELVNRILGSAKISQQGTKMPELPTRTVAETITPEQTAAIRGGKGNSQAPARTRTRVAKMPGFDFRPVIAIVVLLVIIGGAFYAYQSGMIKFNLPDSKTGLDQKVSIDQMIKNGELDRARELLEAKVNSGKITASEGEKLYSIYYQMANKVDDEEPSDAIKLLEKIPSRSKKFKDAQKLLRKLKKKVKKN